MLIFTLPYAVLFWPVFVWAFAPERGIVKRADKSEHSLRFVLMTQGLGTLSAFAIPFLTAHGRIRGTWPFWTGIALLLAGSLLRRHCFRILGESFTGHVAVAEDQQVIDRGAYRWLRHPSYTGGLLMFLGIAFALGNWWSVAVMFASSLAAYGYRIQVEERALLATLGSRYAEFAARRKRLIPFVF